MKQYSFFAVLASLFVLLVGTLIYVFTMGGGDLQNFANIEQTDDSIQIRKADSKLPTWQSDLANLNTRDYAPAAEFFTMHFNPDTSALQPKSKYYQLIIDKNDIYSLFCLKQTLNFFEVKYSLTHNGEETEIFLDTDNKTLLEEIKKRLLVYDIHTQTKEIWL